MSLWTYVKGTITVSPMGRTQSEKTYILNTVLEHLPQVTGSEGGMEVYVIRKNGTNSSCSCDEFGERTNNLVDHYGCKNRNGWLRTQDEYIIVVDGSLRDREFNATLTEFNKWLCRLAKRLWVDSVLVEVSGYDQKVILQNINEVYTNMYESPSWSMKGKRDNYENWCEYLMWKFESTGEIFMR